MSETTTEQTNYLARLMEVTAVQINNSYFQALGKFMHEFAQVEEVLYLLLVGELNLDMKDAAAILSGVRADAAIENTKRLYEARGKTLPDEIKDVFAHIRTLNTARNEIIHFGAYGDGQRERVVSTDLKSHNDQKTKRWTVSEEILEQMYSDAGKAITILLFHISKHDSLKDNQALTRAWLYKYPSNPTGAGT